MAGWNFQESRYSKCKPYCIGWFWQSNLYAFGRVPEKQDGIVYNTDFERFNLRFNGDVKVNNKIKLGNTLSLSKFIEHGADTYPHLTAWIILALTSPPTVTPRNGDGIYAGGNGNIDGFSEPNPVYNLEVPKQAILNTGSRETFLPRGNNKSAEI